MEKMEVSKYRNVGERENRRGIKKNTKELRGGERVKGKMFIHTCQKHSVKIKYETLLFSFSRGMRSVVQICNRMIHSVEVNGDRLVWHT